MSNIASNASIKRYLPTVLSFFSLLVVLFSIARIVVGGGWGWLGPILPAGGFMTFMAWLLRANPPRTMSNLPLLLVVSLLGLAASFLAGGVALWLAGLCTVGNLLYIFWYSHYGRTPSKALVVGQQMPTLLLEDVDGQSVNPLDGSAQAFIFLFYRGNWCPLCMGQIKEIAAQYQELEARNTQVILISPQPHENSRELAARFDISFQFLVDSQNQSARSLGLEHGQGVPYGVNGYALDTVMPTVVITDGSGKILFVDQTDNYRVRPVPATYLRVLDESGVA